MVLDACCRWTSVNGSHLARLRQEYKKGFVKQWRKSWMPKWMGENEIHPSKRPRVAERVAFRVPPMVEPQNLDFDVHEFLRSSPNPVVASDFGDCEIIQKGGSTSGISRDDVSVFELWR